MGMGLSQRAHGWLRALVVLAIVVASAGTPAVAGPRAAPMLVFEAHTGERKPEVAALLVSLEELLETHGFAARPASIVGLLGGRAPLPGISDPGKTAAEIAQAVDSGVHAYVVGDFDAAVATLGKALQLMERNPGLLVTDTKNVDAITRANMTLALALSRLGRTAESTTAMIELIRITRGQPISRSDYGPEADKLYHAVLKQVRALGRGSLTITAGDDRAMIFVEGSLRGMGKATLGDLIPGTYRVFVQVPGTTGRRYSIEVTPEQDHYLAVKAQLEEALSISDGWIGFRFHQEAERKQEARLASELARMWTGEGMVAVVGTSELQGKPALVGTLYRTDGSVVRSASIETDGADRDRLRSLAKFLADGTPDDGLDVLSGEKAPAVAAVRRPTRGRVWPALLVVGGVGAIAAGVTLYAIDEDPDPIGPQEPQYRDTATGGIAIGAAGVVIAGLGAWWWLHGTRRSEASHPTIAVGSSGASIGWTAAF